VNLINGNTFNEAGDYAIEVETPIYTLNSEVTAPVLALVA
jgi:hypothetical protein